MRIERRNCHESKQHKREGRNVMLGLAVVQVSTLLSHTTLRSDTGAGPEHLHPEHLMSVCRMTEREAMAVQGRGVGRRLSSTWQAAWPTQHAAGRKDMKQKPSCRSREKRPTADRNETTQPAVRASAPGAGWANSCKNSFEVGNVTWLRIASLPRSKAPTTCNRTLSSMAGSWQRFR